MAVYRAVICMKQSRVVLPVSMPVSRLCLRPAFSRACRDLFFGVCAAAIFLRRLLHVSDCIPTA